MKLETVQQNVQEGTLDMEIIVNPKSLGKLLLDSCFMSMLGRLGALKVNVEGFQF